MIWLGAWFGAAFVGFIVWWAVREGERIIRNHDDLDED